MFSSVVLGAPSANVLVTATVTDKHSYCIKYFGNDYYVK